MHYLSELSTLFCAPLNKSLQSAWVFLEALVDSVLVLVQLPVRAKELKSFVTLLLVLK